MRPQNEWADLPLDPRRHSHTPSSGGRWLGSTSCGLAIANLIAVIIVLLLLAALWLWVLSYPNIGLAILVMVISNVLVIGAILLVGILTIAGGILAFIGVFQEDEPNRASGRKRCLIALALHALVVVTGVLALVLVIAYYPYLRWALA